MFHSFLSVEANQKEMFRCGNPRILIEKVKKVESVDHDRDQVDLKSNSPNPRGFFNDNIGITIHQETIVCNDTNWQHQMIFWSRFSWLAKELIHTSCKRKPQSTHKEHEQENEKPQISKNSIFAVSEFQENHDAHKSLKLTLKIKDVHSLLWSPLMSKYSWFLWFIGTTWKFRMVCSCQHYWDHSEHFPTCSMNDINILWRTQTECMYFPHHHICRRVLISQKRALRLMYFANNFCLRYFSNSLSLRSCLQFHLALKKNSYPLPMINVLLPLQLNNKIFHAVDATNGFWHIQLYSKKSLSTTFGDLADGCNGHKYPLACLQSLRSSKES